MQKEELRQTQVKLEIARTRYFDLYDLAAVGYCTASEKMLVLGTNLTTVNRLGVARSVLPSQPFPRFILAEGQDIFYLLGKQLFATGESQSGKLRLFRQDGTAFGINMETTVGTNESSKTKPRQC